MYYKIIKSRSKSFWDVPHLNLSGRLCTDDMTIFKPCVAKRERGIVPRAHVELIRVGIFVHLSIDFWFERWLLNLSDPIDFMEDINVFTNLDDKNDTIENIVVVKREEI